jgi:hypothetical protein
VKSDACRRMCIAEAQGIYTSERLSVYRVGFSVVVIVQTLALQQAFRVDVDVGTWKHGIDTLA